MPGVRLGLTAADAFEEAADGALVLAGIHDHTAEGYASRLAAQSAAAPEDARRRLELGALLTGERRAAEALRGLARNLGERARVLRGVEEARTVRTSPLVRPWWRRWLP